MKIGRVSKRIEKKKRKNDETLEVELTCKLFGKIAGLFRRGRQRERNETERRPHPR